MYEKLFYQNESDSLDFKSEQYKFVGEKPEIKSELLKDILAFSNSWRRVNAVILIGVKEVKGKKAEITGIEGQDLDDSQLQQFVNKKTNIPIVFSYKTITVDGKKIGVLDISHKQRPVFLKKNYGKLSKETVYIRRGSSTDIAKPDEVAEMGCQESKEKDIPNLDLEFSNPDNEETFGKILNLTAEIINPSHFGEIPNFVGDSYYLKNVNMPNVIMGESPNSDYYRKLALHYHVQKRKSGIYFGLKNTSESLASGVVIYIEIMKSKDIYLTFENKLPKLIEKYSTGFQIPKMPDLFEPRDILINESPEKWKITIEVGKVYPNHHHISSNLILLSNTSHKTICDCKIVGDNIPRPIKSKLEINCLATELNMSLGDIEDYHQKVTQ